MRDVKSLIVACNRPRYYLLKAFASRCHLLCMMGSMPALKLGLCVLLLAGCRSSEMELDGCGWELSTESFRRMLNQ